MWLPSQRKHGYNLPRLAYIFKMILGVQATSICLKHILSKWHYSISNKGTSLKSPVTRPLLYFFWELSVGSKLGFNITVRYLLNNPEDNTDDKDKLSFKLSTI